ncbi:MAG: hypothetical protein V2B14_04330 [bacterium]
MNNFNNEVEKHIFLYKNIYPKVTRKFEEQINDLKKISFCKKQKFCCKIQYSVLSPAEMFKLKENDILAESMKLFKPYGADDDFDYETNNYINLKNNHNLALEANKKYVDLVLSKLEEPVYFYYCRYLKENNECVLAEKKSCLCNQHLISVDTLFPEECGFREWQKLAVDKIKNQIIPDILIKLDEIKDRKKNFECKKTGGCCRITYSEHSPEELKEKAENGDDRTADFLSIFVPYKNIEEARKEFPEYIDRVIFNQDKDEKIYFFYCQYITKDNTCSIYEKRPEMCKEFPNNPLIILQPNCGFNQWKEDIFEEWMELYILAEISGLYLQKIETLL